MDLKGYHRMRRGMQTNASPGSRKELVGIESNIREMLMTSGIFANVEVEHTDDPDRLVVALCRFSPDYSERDIAEVMEWMWRDRVSYPYWEAHSLIVDRDHVEFQAATRNGDGGRYVTVHLVAQQARIPLQRQPMD